MISTSLISYVKDAVLGIMEVGNTHFNSLATEVIMTTVRIRRPSASQFEIVMTCACMDKQS